MIRMTIGVAVWAAKRRSYDLINLAAVSALATMGTALVACLIKLGEMR